MLLGELPGDTHGQFYSLLRSILLPMKDNPVVDLLTLQESQQEASLQQLFERAEAEDSGEVCDSSNVLSTFSIMPYVHVEMALK